MKKVYVASPRFSHPAGFYDEPFDLSIDSYSTYKVYYTTDGSVPDEHSAPYTGPIHIEDATPQPNSLSARTDITVSDAVPPSSPVKKAAIIRAVAIDPDGNRSNDVINAYFVGFQNYESYQVIPILSNWLQQEKEDMERIQALEAQKAAKFRKILILIGGAICAVIIGGIIYDILVRRRDK